MTTAIARKEGSLKELMEHSKDRITSVLPTHLKPHVDRMIKVALIAVNRTPKLRECTQMSVLESVMNAAELGLDCGGQLGQAYLVPYGKVCQLIIGYRGLVELARRSGLIAGIEVRAVYEGEPFELSFTAAGPVLTHEPDLDGEVREERLRGCYVITRPKDDQSEPEIVWMNKSEIDGIRKRAKSQSGGPWHTDYVEMAKKTVIRRASKTWPLSPELARAFEIDDSSSLGMRAIVDQPEELPEPPTEGRSSFGFDDKPGPPLAPAA